MTTATRIPIEVGPVAHSIDDEAQHDPTTATLWTLHLRCGSTVKSVQTLAARIYKTGAESIIAHWGGDSFHEWCEPYDADKARENDQPGRALHIQFYAPNVDVAVAGGRLLAQAAGITSGFDATVSTTATHDYQYEVFELTADEEVQHVARLASLGYGPDGLPLAV